ncbi:hypothetical protein [Acanthopleuribacter pedis]|uniref:Uncharacterized protein n=1 Tax=Acanthopleuribacter pedis TaxID=442870 RepID=A0A8J7U679_9BACT|nr:hypothetical protein [Acanthopleuribacter pedis]MBO1323328.1 hypothetical protein [Acanthopleuribacter pedis]
MEIANAGQAIKPENGRFTYEGSAMSLDMLVMMLEMETVSILDNQIASRLEEIDRRNKRVEKVNRGMAFAKQARTDVKNKDGDNPKTNNSKWNDFVADLREDPELRGLANDLKTGNLSEADWEANVTHLENYISGQNNISQQDMLKLQTLMTNRGHAFNLATNTLSKVSETKRNILSKF